MSNSRRYESRPSNTMLDRLRFPCTVASLIFTFSSLCLCASVVESAETPRQTLTVGNIAVSVAPWHEGLRVQFDGIEVLKHSELVVTTPPWAPHYYLGPSADAVTSAVREPLDNGQRLRLTHEGENESFEALETITVQTDGRVELVFEGRFLKPEGDALIQWQMGAINPVLIVGRPYRATLRNGESVNGIVPVTARFVEADQAALAKRFSAIEFDSRIGPLRLEVETDRDVIVYDYRLSRWATAEDPYFWFGDLGTRFKKGDTLRYRVVFQLPQPPTTRPAEQVAHARATLLDNADAQTCTRDEPPIIIPRPKEAKFEKGVLTLVEHATKSRWLAVEGDWNQEAGPDRAGSRSRPVVEFVQFMQQQFGVRPFSPSTVGRGVFFISGSDADKLVAEGYEIRINDEFVRVTTADREGARNAVQTLKQLITVAPNGDIVVPLCTIRDWPSLPFRGIHLFTGGQGPDLHEKLIRNVLGPLKINRLVLEAEYIEWDSHPELHHPQYGMPKDDVRKILSTCQDLGIEVIPLVMSLGHCQWMFETGHNLDLAEDPEAKWTYCITNPKTYEFIFQIYDEALDLFKPKVFHIGHDEFTHRGRVPFREASKAYTPEQILMLDTKRLHEWLTQRGVKVMMWGDMLLGPGEGPDACHAQSVESARALRQELPKDIVIADWHYTANPPADYVNLDKFQASGHQAIAATWNRAQNITNFAKAAYDKKALGFLQTTWAGYSLDPASFQKEMAQYAAYVIAAEAAWNADQPPDPETYPAGAYFLDLMGLSSLKPEQRSGWTADLHEAYNYALAAGGPVGWFGLGPDYDLSAVPHGDVRLKGLAFKLADASEAPKPSAVVLRSKLTRDSVFPTSVEITVDRRADRLAILHATNFACPSGTKVADYGLTYDDGTTATVELIYGRNILAYTDLNAAADAPLVWSGRTTAGQGVGLRALIWQNPHPERVIRTLTARSADAAGALLLIGVTGLDAPARQPTSQPPREGEAPAEP